VDRKVEILGVAGSGKSTVARSLTSAPPFERAGFIHAREPAHLVEIVRSVPTLWTIIRDGLRPPRITWPEIKLLVYVSRWDPVLSRRLHPENTVLVFDQGPLYALGRLEAEARPFSTRPAFRSWRGDMLARWAERLSTVIWLDAPDQVLWRRINERTQDHRSKGASEEEGIRFIRRYRRTFDILLGEVEDLGGPRVVRLDTSELSREDVAEAARSALTEDHARPSAETHPETADG
jgi:cytidylate kinase